jgi:GNAT superfamily N-acetyltransferase
MSGMAKWIITPMPVDHPDSAEILRDYYTDIVGRYYRREATASEVDSAMADEPSADLTPPTGLFLLARREGVLSGCVGMRVLEPNIAGLTRVFVHPGARRDGGASRLIAAAEEAARDIGADIMRLDVRSDLVEARALYARHGYQEVAPFSDSQYADHWFEKVL